MSRTKFPASAMEAASAKAGPRASGTIGTRGRSKRVGAEDDAINPKTGRPMWDHKAARRAGLKEGSGYGKNSPNGTLGPQKKAR